MIALDASVIIAHLYVPDPHHETATDYLRNSADQGFVVHSLNLAEVLVTAVRAAREQEVLADLEAMGVRVADVHEGEALRLARLRATSGLKLPDCCALDTAIITGSTLATFDDSLAKAARKFNVAVAPGSQSGYAEPDRNGDSGRSADSA